MANVRNIVTNLNGNVIINSESDNGARLQVTGNGTISGDWNASGYVTANGEGLGASLRVGGIYGDLGLYVPSTYDMQFDLGWAGSFKFTRSNVDVFKIDPSGVLFNNSGYLAYGDGTFTNLYAPDTNGGITMGDATAPINVYYNDTHTFQSAAQLADYGAFTSTGLGIGTTNPTSKLYVEGGSANWNETTPGTSVGTIHLDPGVSTDDFGNAITFGASDFGGGASAQAGIYLRTDGNYGTKMYFATTDSYTVGSKTRMFINNNGNVLIGTTTDAGYKLRVNGSSYFDAPILCYTGNGYITALTNDGVGSNNGFGYSFLINNTGHEIGRITGIYETSGSGGSGGIGFWTRASGTLSAKMTLNSGGTLTLSSYGSGSKTGTVAYNLAVDSSGNIIETAGGVVDGSGTANYVSKWSDANTLTDSVIYDDGTNVGIGTLPNQGVRLQVAGAVDAWNSLNTLLRLSHDGTRGKIQSYTGGGYSATALNADGGNVLIGTDTDAGYKLDVNGTGRFSNTVYINKGGRVLSLGVDYANHINWDSNVDLALNISNGGTGNIAFFGGGANAVSTLYANGGALFTNSVTASSLIKSGGTSSEYLMADGSVSTTATINNYTQTFYVPNTGGTAQWAKLGTWTATQGGNVVTVQIDQHAGYNATTGQNQQVYIYMKTSNGSSVDANGFAGDSSFWTEGINQAIQSGDVIWEANAAGVAATSYTLYVNLGAYTNASQYTVTTRGGTWTNVATLASPSGTTPSSTILLSENRFVVNNILTVGGAPSGNVLIGTYTDGGYKLDVNGNTRSNGIIIGTDQTYGGTYRSVSFGANQNGYNRIFATTDAADGMYFASATGTGFTFRPNGGTADLVRITSAGLVSVGNDSPQANGSSAVLDVGNTQGGTLNLRDTNTGIAAEGFNQIYGGDNRMYLYAGGSGASSYMQFYTNDVERMRIASNGVVGVGIVPNANWGTGFNYSATQFRNAALYYRTTGAEFYIMNNSYYDGSSWRYMSGAAAAMLELGNNNFEFFSVANGNAGDSFTWSSRMKIVGGTGNVLIGTTTDAGYKLDVNGNTRIQGNSYVTSRNYISLEGNLPVAYKIPYTQLAGGTVVSDNLANGGSAKAIYSSSTPGTFFFGPYSSIEPGSYVAKFRLKVASNASSSSIGTIDVAGTNIAGNSLLLRPSMFPTSGDYYYFSVPFTVGPAASGSLETRWLNWPGGITDAYVDHVFIESAQSEAEVYVPTNKDFNVYTDGTSKLVVKNNGNVGLGTTSPSTRLDVLSSTSNSSIRTGGLEMQSYGVNNSWYAENLFFNGGTWQLRSTGYSTQMYMQGGTIDFNRTATGNGGDAVTLLTTMRLNNTGNVLIGTTTDAGYKLDVNGSGRFSGLLQVNGPGSVARADSHGISLFNGNDDYRISFDSQSGTRGFIRYNVDTVGSTLHGHIFSAGDFSGGSVTDLMLVRADGNVGIGTTSPADKLHVSGSGNTATFITGSGCTTYIQSVTSETRIGNLTAGGGSIIFAPTDTERMRITSAGNVGIGTTAPDTPLSSARGIVINSGASNDVQIRMQNNTTGSAGSDGGLLSISGSQMYLWNYEASNLIFGTNNSERMRIDSSGNIGIGTTSISYRVDISGDARILSGSLGVGVAPNATDGRIDASNDIVAYSTSDQRLKENVTPIENALEKVKTLTGVEFDWKEETAHVHGYHGHDIGIIAQDVQAVLPEAVRTNDSGYLSVRYEKMIALLIEANKELAARVEELEKKLK